MPRIINLPLTSYNGHADDVEISVLAPPASESDFYGIQQDIPPHGERPILSRFGPSINYARWSQNCIEYMTLQTVPLAIEGVWGPMYAEGPLKP